MSSRSLRRKRLFRPPASPGTAQKIGQIEETPDRTPVAGVFPSAPDKTEEIPCRNAHPKGGPDVSAPPSYPCRRLFFSQYSPMEYPRSSVTSLPRKGGGWKAYASSSEANSTSA